MKIYVSILIPFCLLADCNNIARQENEAKTPVKQATSSPQNVNTAFKGEKHFELEISPSTSNYMLYRQKYLQREEECKTLCEKTCGGKCLKFMEVLNKCFKENPKLKRGYGSKENVGISLNNVPSIKTKYPFWFYVAYPQQEMSSPPPKTVDCIVICN